MDGGVVTPMTDGDSDGHGEPYSDYDTYWRDQKAEAKTKLKRALGEYDQEIQIAAISEVADEYVQRWAEHSFSEQYPKEDE